MWKREIKTHRGKILSCSVSIHSVNTLNIKMFHSCFCECVNLVCQRRSGKRNEGMEICISPNWHMFCKHQAQVNACIYTVLFKFYYTNFIPQCVNVVTDALEGTLVHLFWDCLVLDVFQSIFEFPNDINELYFPTETWLFSEDTHITSLSCIISFDDWRSASQKNDFQRLGDNNSITFLKMVTRSDFLSHLLGKKTTLFWLFIIGNIFEDLFNNILRQDKWGLTFSFLTPVLSRANT